MDTMRICGECGAALAADAPESLCPKCLLKAGMGTEASLPGQEKKPKPNAPSPEEIAKFFPQLEIVELLGQGGMGMVYKARQLQLDRFVALKILSPELSRDPAFAERFTREARALARLNHPNIVGVYDFGQAGDFYYFMMEYVDGMNLWQMEQVKKPLAPEEALAIIPRICDALQYAHDEGIVHRDIKPGNILIDKKGRVKIADFGLAKLLGQQPQDFNLTQSKMMLGTPQYMAPEQFEDAQKVDHRVDIYSLGVVFYEMLTGELPMGRFALPSEKVQVDVRFDEVVLRALARKPELRYQHASEVKTDVDTIGRSQPAKTEADVAVPRAIKSAATGLLAAASIYLATVPAIIFVEALSGRGGLSGRAGAAAGLFLFSSAAYGFVFVAALKMRRLQSWRMALGGSIFLLALTLGNIFGLAIGDTPKIAILTPGVWLGHLLGIKLTLAEAVGLPMGIWALAVLARSDVRAAFERARAQGKQGRSPERKTWLAGVATLAVFTTIALILLWIWPPTLTSNPRQTQIETPDSVTVLKAFTPDDKPISADFALTETNAWSASCATTQTFRLYELPDPGVERCVVTYRAKVKTQNLIGRAYLEMWCSFTGQGESFSRGLDNTLTGSNDWTMLQTPFFLKAGEKPDLIRLNLVVEGSGKIFIKDIQLIIAPLK